MRIDYGQVHYEIGDIITDLKNTEYHVTDVLSGGAQNSGIYLVTRADKRYVLKILVNHEEGCEDSESSIGSVKMKNVVNMLKESNRFARLQLSKEESCGCFIMPLVLFNPEIDGMVVKGYLMSYAKGENIIKVLYEDKTARMYVALMNLCAVFRRLQNYGFNFKDLSADNVLYDGDSEKIFIIDCDNIQRNTTGMYRNQVDLMAKGTGWAIAPELVYRDSVQNGNTDSFSLAYLLFTILVSTEKIQKINKINGKEVLGRVKYFSIHPYYGESFRKSVSTGSTNLSQYRSYAESEGISDSEKFLVFIFDSKNTSNTVNTNIPRFKLFADRWDALPHAVKENFREAFSDPFERHRPTANKWENCFKTILVCLKTDSASKTVQINAAEQTLKSGSSDETCSGMPKLCCFIGESPNPAITGDRFEIPGSLVGSHSPSILFVEVFTDRFKIHNSSFLTLQVNGVSLKKGSDLEFDLCDTVRISNLLFKDDIVIRVD